MNPGRRGPFRAIPSVYGIRPRALPLRRGKARPPQDSFSNGHMAMPPSMTRTSSKPACFRMRAAS